MCLFNLKLEAWQCRYISKWKLTSMTFPFMSMFYIFHYINLWKLLELNRWTVNLFFMKWQIRFSTTSWYKLLIFQAWILKRWKFPPLTSMPEPWKQLTIPAVLKPNETSNCLNISYFVLERISLSVCPKPARIYLAKIKSVSNDYMYTHGQYNILAVIDIYVLSATCHMFDNTDSVIGFLVS